MEINVLLDEGFEDCPQADWLQAVAGIVLAAEDVDPEAELGLVIVDQEEVQRLNSMYLGRDRPTDVLAFSMLPEMEPGEEETEDDLPPFVEPPDEVPHLGEVIVSYPQAVIQAAERHHSVKKEMAILIIHGILHLLGYDHDKPAPEQQMRAREGEILGLIEEKGY